MDGLRTYILRKIEKFEASQKKERGMNVRFKGCSKIIGQIKGTIKFEYLYRRKSSAVDDKEDEDENVGSFFPPGCLRHPTRS